MSKKKFQRAKILYRPGDGLPKECRNCKALSECCLFGRCDPGPINSHKCRTLRHKLKQNKRH